MRGNAFLAAALLVLMGISSASAQSRVRERVRAGEVQPLDQILPQIREGYPGAFYDAQGPFPGPDGRPHYRIKWLTPDGHIVWFNADARSGRIIGIEGAPRFYGRPPPPGAFRGGPVRPFRFWRGWGGGPRGRGRHGR